MRWLEAWNALIAPRLRKSNEAARPKPFETETERWRRLVDGSRER